MVEGRCHCGNVSLQVPAITEFGTTCTCSICFRYGVIWGYYRKNEVCVRVSESDLMTYRHGDCLIDFNRCAVCGCVTHYCGTENSASETIAVNFRMFEPDLQQKLTLRTFDGARTWKYLETDSDAMGSPASIKNAEKYSWGANSIGWHLLNDHRLSVIEELVPPGDGEQRHYHRQAQQFFYVLQGAATIEMEGQIFDLSAREGLHVPARCSHQLFNNGPTDLRFLVISSPRSHGDRVLSDTTS